MAMRRSGFRAVSGFFALLGLAGAAPAIGAPGSFITTVPITGGFADPLGVTNAGDGSGRLFVVQQCGQIRIVNGTTLLATPFLDIGSTSSNLIACGGEQGLLGLAFHPNYASNGFFYVYYNRRDDPATPDNEGGDVVVARFQVSANPNLANGASGTVLLVVEHSQNAFHNGGQIAFGPDGFLYIAIGDAGGGSGPVANGQNLNVLLGKVLRIDVNGDDFPADPARNYAIPATNPFAGATPGADEIWAYGFRNPWRLSFDRLTGDLFIADVGQLDWEEIDRQPAADAGGENYGWDCREGTHDYSGTLTTGCGSVVSVDPILEYSHAENQIGAPCSSITGGFVFRNLPLHSMYGNYLFGDFCSGRIWRGIPAGGGAWTRTQLFDTTFSISSFGQSQTGRIYFTDITADDLKWLAPYTFADVPPNGFAWDFIESVNAAGVIQGCGGDNFCPNNNISRAEMASFLLLAKEGSGYSPPPCTTPMFNDVPCSHPYATWINEIARRGITVGCGGGNYCPNGSINRNEMSVFLLATQGGPGYSPPACVTPTFADVPCSSPFGKWVNEIARRGITAGCGGGNFCPTNAVNRSQMSVFLATTFGLPVP